MFSFYKVIFFTEGIENIEISKSYYDKCYEGLKTLNERSIRISQYILLLVLLYLFRKYFTSVKIYDNKVDIQLLKILTPTLLSYFVLEWLMMAKRRRDLIFALQHSSYKIFLINPEEEERFFPAFNPNTLNIMPYTFMCEILTIDNKKSFTFPMRKISLLTILITLIFVVGCAFVDAWETYDLHFSFIWPSTRQIFLDLVGFYVCLIVSLQCIIWIVYHYYIEFQYLNEVKKLIKSSLKNNNNEHS